MPDIQMPEIKIPETHAPEINVSSSPVDVHLNIDAKTGKIEKTTHVERDEKGDIKSFRTTEEEK
jgi:hypothetical protein